MTFDLIEATVMDILITEFGVKPASLSPSTSLVAGSGLDSFGIIDLTNHLERQFGIAIPDEALSPEMFQSVSALARSIQMILESTPVKEWGAPEEDTR